MSKADSVEGERGKMKEKRKKNTVNSFISRTTRTKEIFLSLMTAAIRLRKDALVVPFGPRFQ